MRRVSFDRFKGNNTGLLLWGERGCGKSQILTYATAWSHENQWINFSITDPEAFTSGKTDLFRFKNGLYLQKDLAVKLLKDFKHSNEQILNEFQVDMTHYGKYDISGVKDGEPEPCPRVWDAKR
jgi:small subunit ribosomal protein S29